MPNSFYPFLPWNLNSTTLCVCVCVSLSLSLSLSLRGIMSFALLEAQYTHEWGFAFSAFYAMVSVGRSEAGILRGASDQLIVKITG